MYFEVGPVTIATGRHRSTSPTSASLSSEASHAIGDPVLEKFGPGGAVNPSGTALVQSMARSMAAPAALESTAGGDAAAGNRPTPGPLPPREQISLDAFKYQFPYSINQVWTPRTGRTPFELLRTFSRLSDIVRTCIETRKDQISSLDFTVGPKKGMEVPADRLEALRAFWASPDRRRPFKTWLRAIIEEVLVTDALSIYRTRTRAGALYALRIIDGTTIKVLLDEAGEIPLPPNKAFRQIIYGAPTKGGDYGTDELIYAPRTVLVDSPYGMSPTESVLLTLLSLINRQVFNLQYYSEGNVPSGLIETAIAMTPQQLRDYQEYLDVVLATRNPHKLKAVPKDSKVHQFTNPDWAVGYDEFLLKVACAAFAVPPSEIGFTGDVNRATANAQENIVYRRGVKPLVGFLKDLIDMVLAVDLGSPDCEAVFQGGEPEDRLVSARADQIEVDMGKVSVDELRTRDGLEPIGLGHYVRSGAGVQLVEDLLAPPEPVPAQFGQPGPRLDPTSTALEPPEPLTEAARADLRKYRTLAIKDVKAGRPVRAFVADALDASAVAAIGARLAKAVTLGDVVDVFGQAEASLQKRRTKASPRAALARSMSKTFTTTGRKLAMQVAEALA